MKKLFTTLAAVMFVAVMSMGLGSCGKKKMIIGEWQMIEECDDEDDECEDVKADAIFVTFEKDGTYEWKEDGYTCDKGKWEISDGVLTLNPDKGSNEEYKIKKLMGKKMVLIDKVDEESLVFKKQ